MTVSTLTVEYWNLIECSNYVFFFCTLNSMCTDAETSKQIPLMCLEAEASLYNIVKCFVS